MNTFGRGETAPPARIEYLKVQNFRALHHLELKDLTPLTVLLGPNGSGKSTVFDVFAFLSECFRVRPPQTPGIGAGVPGNSRHAVRTVL